MSAGLTALVLGALLLLVAWLVAGATAVRSVSRIWLRHWVERRARGATVAAMYLERPHRLLIAGGTGVAMALVTAGVVLGTRVTDRWSEAAARVLVAALTVLVVGQLVPRALARRFPVRLVPVLLPLLRAVELLITPVVLLARSLRAGMRTSPPAGSPADVAREHIEDLLREGQLEGVGERDEIAIITGVVQFGEKTVAEVMTPRAELFVADAGLPPAELARHIAGSGFSRVPLVDGSPDRVVGMVHAFDVLKAGIEARPPVRPVANALATKHCNELLFEMLRRRLHLAVVRDDAGLTVGIVTLEDLLEELVGDIRDEHDDPAPPAAGNTARLDGVLPSARIR